MDNCRSRRAFTLVEIIIVVGMILVLVSIVVPAFLRSRTNAGDAAAIGNLRTLNKACQMYYLNSKVYPEDLATLANSPPYIDSRLAEGNKQGYEFIYTRPDEHSFYIRANPTDVAFRGRYFYVDQTDVIRANPDTEAGPSDEEIGK